MNHYFLTLLLVVLTFSSTCTQKETTETMVAEAPVKQWAPDDTRNIPGLNAKRGLIKNSSEATPGICTFSPRCRYRYLADEP